MQTKVCTKCHEEKPLTVEYFRRKKYKTKDGHKEYWTLPCRECERKYNLATNKQRYLRDIQWHKDYSAKNKKRLAEYNAKWASKNKERIRSYHKTDAHKEYQKLWARKKRKEDIAFNLRSIISCSINYVLRKQSSSKHGNSCLKYLPYTMEELKKHIESQFEPWMNWSNHGKYNVAAWNDNDQSTWTWQIDHIIPHSDLPYDSMDSDNFQKAWAIKNLRPLSSKQNLIEGVKRTRHNLVSTLDTI